MSYFTTIHDLTSCLSWYPAHTYVRFFGRVLRYDDKTGAFLIQELPAFFVEISVSTPASSQATSSPSQGDPVSLTPRPLPLAKVFVQSESGATAVAVSGPQVADSVHNSLVVEVFARVRGRQPGARRAESGQLLPHDDEGGAPTCNVTPAAHVRTESGVGDTSCFTMQQPQISHSSSFSSSSPTVDSPTVHLDLMKLQKIDTQTIFDDLNSQYVQAVLLKAVLVRETLRTRVLLQAAEEESG